MKKKIKSVKKSKSAHGYPICIVGAGHVGLVAAACFAELGHRVVCVDSDAKKIDALRRLIVPFFEPELEGLLKRTVKSKKLTFTSDLDKAVQASEVIFIAVGTPPREDGSADLTSVEHVAQTIAKNLNAYKLVVGKSTVPVHTGRQIKETILRYRKDNIDFDVASNPEFLREGKAVYDSFYPDRIVIGVESKRAEEIFRKIYIKIKAPIVVTDVNTAELIKHASNSLLAVKISFINAVSRVCDLAGADVQKVALAMGLDRRIGKDFLSPGIGYGGFCFPKDLEAFMWISKKLGYDFGLLKEVKKINEAQKTHFVEKVKENLWVLKNKQIAILGLSFKPDTDDMRFAPSVDIIRLLIEEGACLKLYDPQAIAEARRIFKGEGISFAQNPYDAVKGCDCLCVLTEWDEFRRLDFKKIQRTMRLPLIIDGRNMFERGKLEKLGFRYACMGR